jgi:hypothetical protein
MLCHTVFILVLVLHHKAVRKWTDSTCEVVLYNVYILPYLINIIIKHANLVRRTVAHVKCHLNVIVIAL